MFKIRSEQIKTLYKLIPVDETGIEILTANWQITAKGNLVTWYKLTFTVNVIPTLHCDTEEKMIPVTFFISHEVA